MRVLLSNPQGAFLPEKHQRARGLIFNTDPMPKAWLGEFSHSIGTSVVDGILDRLGSRTGTGAWSRGTYSDISGSDLSGHSTGVVVGHDLDGGDYVAGLSLASFKADGKYELGGHHYATEGLMTGAFPYASWQATDSVTLWGVAGVGNGDISVITDDFNQSAPVQVMPDDHARAVTA